MIKAINFDFSMGNAPYETRHFLFSALAKLGGNFWIIIFKLHLRYAPYTNILFFYKFSFRPSFW